MVDQPGKKSLCMMRDFKRTQSWIDFFQSALERWFHHGKQLIRGSQKENQQQKPPQKTLDLLVAAASCGRDIMYAAKRIQGMYATAQANANGSSGAAINTRENQEAKQ